ncbi:hypothetical protein MP638_001420 [Amoeboaphelidium occidentale]|nr:hypothetical protein MP638_001420 [Amoeboaphelidium occidentale]
MNHKRLLLECNLSTDCKGLKTAIKEFLASKDVGCRIQKRLKEDNESYYTNLLVESSMDKSIFEMLNDLKALLQNQFPEFAHEKFEWNILNHESPFMSAAIIKTTEPALSREDSSGLVDDVDDLAPKDSISQAVSMSSSAFVKAAEFTMAFLQFTGKVSIEKVVVKIQATDGKCHDFDITGKRIMSMEDFLNTVRLSPVLQLKSSPRKIYSRHSDGTYSEVSEVSCLLHEHKYYVFTDIDDLPVNPPSSSSAAAPNGNTTVFSSMEEFYAKLGTCFLEKNRVQNVNYVKEKFEELGADVGYLPGMTDEGLKAIGVESAFIRSAMLGVVRK